MVKELAESIVRMAREMEIRDKKNSARFGRLTLVSKTRSGVCDFLAICDGETQRGDSLETMLNFCVEKGYHAKQEDLHEMLNRVNNSPAPAHPWASALALLQDTDSDSDNSDSDLEDADFHPFTILLLFGRSE